MIQADDGGAMATITIEIPDEIARQYESLDEIRRTMYEDFVIEQRQQGKFSLGEAANLLNISYAEFFDLIGRKRLSFINATTDELDESYHRFQHIMKRASS